MNHAVPSIFLKPTTPSESKILSIFIHEEREFSTAHVWIFYSHASKAIFLSHNAIKNAYTSHAQNKMADRPTDSGKLYIIKFQFDSMAGDNFFYVNRHFINLTDKRQRVSKPWSVNEFESRGSNEEIKQLTEKKHESHISDLIHPLKSPIRKLNILVDHPWNSTDISTAKLLLFVLYIMKINLFLTFFCTSRFYYHTP